MSSQELKPVICANSVWHLVFEPLVILDQIHHAFLSSLTATAALVG